VPNRARAVGGSFRSIMTALTVIGAFAVVALVWSERAGNPIRLVAKPLASVCFIGVALVAGAADTAYGRWVLIALVLSAIGDVALLGRSSATFLVGLASFLLGHVAYCIAFVERGADLRAILVAALVMVVPGLAVVRWLWPHVPDEMRAPVAAYAVVISAMVACAVGTVVREGDVRILAAAIGFYCSDLSVARDRFVAPGPVNRVWGLPLYYAAQFLFAWTVIV
jgi:uncharacterized membrane protein YhhN